MKSQITSFPLYLRINYRAIFLGKIILFLFKRETPQWNLDAENAKHHLTFHTSWASKFYPGCHGLSP